LPLAYNALVTVLQEACLARGAAGASAGVGVGGKGKRGEGEGTVAEAAEVGTGARVAGLENSSSTISPAPNEGNMKFTNESSVSSPPGVGVLATGAGAGTTGRGQRTLGRKKSTVEEFLGWIGTDMDEGTWRQTSNLTHFRKRKGSDSAAGGGGAMKPSNILSSNSKDRYRAMKANLLNASTSEEGIPEESGESSRSHGSLKGKLFRSGRNSYANLYGTMRRDQSQPQREQGEDEEEEGEMERKREERDVENEAEEMSLSRKVKIKPGAVILSGSQEGSVVGTGTGEGAVWASASPAKNFTSGSGTGTGTGEGHLFQLASFDFRSNRIVPTATAQPLGGGGDDDEEKKVDLTAEGSDLTNQMILPQRTATHGEGGGSGKGSCK
jgi:hypothetical protein